MARSRESRAYARELSDVGGSARIARQARRISQKKARGEGVSALADSRSDRKKHPSMKDKAFGFESRRRAMSVCFFIGRGEVSPHAPILPPLSLCRAVACSQVAHGLAGSLAI